MISSTKSLRGVVAIAALFVARMGFAEEGVPRVEIDDAGPGKAIVIPDATAISEDDDKAIRKTLSDYYKAVQSGDREKAYSFCVFKGKLQEKVCRLACEADFITAKLRTVVEKKFGKEQWEHIGKMLSEMNEDVLKSVKVESTDDPDEVQVSWNDEADVGKDRSMPSSVKMRKVKAGWRFVFEGEKDELVEMRKQFRDELAELTEIVAKVEDGTFKDVDGLKGAINELIGEILGPEDAPDGDPVGPEPGVNGVPVQPPMVPE